MANGLINKELIMKAWTHLRKTEMTIPDETLDFMRDVSLEKCAEMEVCDWGMANTGERQLTIPDVMPRISHFIDENGTTVDLNAEGVNVRLKRDGTHEYFRSFGFAGRKELTPVYGA